MKELIKLVEKEEVKRKEEVERTGKWGMGSSIVDMKASIILLPLPSLTKSHSINFPFPLLSWKNPLGVG